MDPRSDAYLENWIRTQSYHLAIDKDKGFIGKNSLKLRICNAVTPALRAYGHWPIEKVAGKLAKMLGDGLTQELIQESHRRRVRALSLGGVLGAGGGGQQQQTVVVGEVGIPTGPRGFAPGRAMQAGGVGGLPAVVVPPAVAGVKPIAVSKAAVSQKQDTIVVAKVVSRTASPTPTSASSSTTITTTTATTEPDIPLPPDEPPSPPPFKLQHRILTTLQTLLESTCYSFAETYYPDLLTRKCWDCPEAGELTAWTREILKEFLDNPLPAITTNTPPTKTTTITSTANFTTALKDLDEIRHAAVHRIPCDAAKIKVYISNARTAASMMLDSQRAEEIAGIQGMVERMMDEIRVVKWRAKVKLRRKLDTLERAKLEIEREMEEAKGEAMREGRRVESEMEGRLRWEFDGMAKTVASSDSSLSSVSCPPIPPNDHQTPNTTEPPTINTQQPTPIATFPSPSSPSSVLTVPPPTSPPTSNLSTPKPTPDPEPTLSPPSSPPPMGEALLEKSFRAIAANNGSVTSISGSGSGSGNESEKWNGTGVAGGWTASLLPNMGQDWENKQCVW